MSKIVKLKIVLKQYAKTLLQKTLLPICYKMSKKPAVNKKLVILADSNCSGTPDSMIQIRDELKRRGFCVKQMYLDFSKSSIGAMLRFMLDFMKAYANAGAVFICNYFLPVTACKKRSETLVVQLWHGCGCLKKFGYDSSEDISSQFKGSASKNFDVVTVSSPECVKPFQSAFRLTHGEVRPLGVSRTDVFFKEGFKEQCVKEFYGKYPVHKGKKILLYAPTFRGNASNAYCRGEEHIKSLADKLGEDWAVIIKMHPRLNSSLTNCTIDTSRLLAVADLLITDYSSLVFEYAFFNKPMILFTPDLSEYTAARSFYIDIQKQMPCPIVTNGDKLYEEVLSCRQGFDRKRYEQFYSKYMSSCDGNATLRIADLLNDTFGDD